MAAGHYYPGLEKLLSYVDAGKEPHSGVRWLRGVLAEASSNRRKPEGKHYVHSQREKAFKYTSRPAIGTDPS